MTALAMIMTVDDAVSTFSTLDRESCNRSLLISSQESSSLSASSSLSEERRLRASEMQSKLTRPFRSPKSEQVESATKAVTDICSTLDTSRSLTL